MKDFIQFIGLLESIGDAGGEEEEPYVPSLDFSDARNSQYLALLEDI